VQRGNGRKASQAFSIVNVGTCIGHSVADVLQIMNRAMGGQSTSMQLKSGPDADWVVLDNSRPNGNSGGSTLLTFAPASVRC
jgi:hypothetical protein